MENAIKNSLKLNFGKTAAGAAFQQLNGLSPGCSQSRLPAANGSLHSSLPAFLAASYDVIIGIGGHAVNNGVENRKRRKAY